MPRLQANGYKIKTYRSVLRLSGMIMNTLKYKDFIGSVAFSETDGVFFVKSRLSTGLFTLRAKALPKLMRHISLLLLISFTIPVWAAPVTPDAALKRLQSQNVSRIREHVRTPHFRISEIMTDSCGNNTVYIFDSKPGFVVTPADDALPALLGYGDGQMYDSDGNLPTGFREWLQYMSRRVSTAAVLGNFSAIQCFSRKQWLRHTVHRVDMYSQNCEC